jgi:hypothetical protein
MYKFMRNYCFYKKEMYLCHDIFQRESTYYYKLLKINIMSLLYTVIPRNNPQDKETPPKQHTIAVPHGTITSEQLPDTVCDVTTLNRDEARMSFNRLSKKAEKYLSLGFNVHLGELGDMHVTMKSNGLDKPEDATAIHDYRHRSAFRVRQENIRENKKDSGRTRNQIRCFRQL